MHDSNAKANIGILLDPRAMAHELSKVIADEYGLESDDVVAETLALLVLLELALDLLSRMSFIHTQQFNCNLY